MKVVINICYGGFGLSKKALEWLKTNGLDMNLYDRYDDSLRSNPLLVKCVEELGKKANGEFAKLRVVEIPDGVQYVIEEYDGVEHIAEKHRTWG